MSRSSCKKAVETREGGDLQAISIYHHLEKSVDESEIKATYRLKIDYGSRHTGLAILRGQEVVWLGQLDHRTDIKERIDKRRAFVEQDEIEKQDTENHAF